MNYGKLQSVLLNSEVVLLLCSPEEAYQLFTSHRITEQQFSQQGSQLVSDPALMCCLGSALYSWQQVAPAVMGALAFGGDWQHMLPPAGGVPVSLPAFKARLQQDSRKVRGAAVCISGKYGCVCVALHGTLWCCTLLLRDI